MAAASTTDWFFARAPGRFEQAEQVGLYLGDWMPVPAGRVGLEGARTTELRWQRSGGEADPASALIAREQLGVSLEGRQRLEVVGLKLAPGQPGHFACVLAGELECDA